jgi:hypothetical protein
MMLTEESLGVFWLGEEADGILAYGLWPGNVAPEPLFPRELWPADTECRAGRLTGAGWEILMWTIKIADWPRPSDWEETIRGTLARMISAGALLAWLGLEGHFADPPSLFAEEEMSGSVYSVLSPSLGFICKALLGSQFQTISDEDLQKLRHIVNVALGPQQTTQ